MVAADDGEGQPVLGEQGLQGVSCVVPLHLVGALVDNIAEMRDEDDVLVSRVGEHPIDLLPEFSLAQCRVHLGIGKGDNHEGAREVSDPTCVLSRRIFGSKTALTRPRGCHAGKEREKDDHAQQEYRDQRDEKRRDSRTVDGRGRSHAVASFLRCTHRKHSPTRKLSA